MLLKAIQSICRQHVPPSISITLYVLDTSDTSDGYEELIRIVLPFQKKITLQYVHEPHLTKGIIYARKRLFSLVKEAYLFSLDDDITADPQWIYTGLRKMKQNTKIGIVFGKTVMQNGPPQRFLSTLAGLGFNKNFWPYALTDLGDTAYCLKKLTHYPSFSNMAIRMRFVQSITFDARFAHTGGMLPMYGGEDPDFCRQMQKISKIYYVPSMVVRHFIKPHKFTKKYFYWRYWEWAKERALLEKKYNLPHSSSLKTVCRAMRNCIKETFHFQLTFFTQLQCLFSLSYIRALFVLNLMERMK